MRDKRFVAQHRGGLLALATHRRLAAWAADCAEHVLPLFERCSADPRPRRAIEMAKAWARGEATVGQAQKAAVAAHAAARKMKDKSAIAAARAAGHAVATAHMADHCFGPCIYGLKAVMADGRSAATERKWQLDHVPRGMKQLVRSGLKRRLAKLKGPLSHQPQA